jgi:hypothetical protein
MDWLACDEHTIQFRKRSLDLVSLFFWVSLNAIERTNNTIIQDPVSD